MLLANILFLTSVWGWSVLRAGIAVTPGPLMAALSATVGGRLADRYGQRVVALPGGLLFAAGCVVFATGTGATPHYASEFLPATLLTGTGVGLSFAAWGSAAVAELPPSRFATGSAISATSRQIGAVLGIAVLVAVIGTPRPEDADLDLPHRVGADGHPGDRRRPHGPGPRPRPRSQPRGGGGAGDCGGVSAPGGIRTSRRAN